MPQRQLTPLGRQLRSVLANFVSPTATRPASLSSSARSPSTLKRSTKSHAWCDGSYRSQRGFGSQVATAAVSDELETAVAEPPSLGFNAGKIRSLRNHSWRRLNRRTHIDHITLALCSVGKHHLVCRGQKARRDLSHANIKSRQRWSQLDENRKRHVSGHVQDAILSNEFSLKSILASWIRNRSKDHLEAAPSIGLSAFEVRYVQSKGYTALDIAAWAKIVSADDSLEAAVLLAQRVDRDGPRAVPAFVYMQLLRRDYLSARALRILLQRYVALTNAKCGLPAQRGPLMPSVFSAVVRFIRHAREVWPPAIPSIADFFIRLLQCAPSTTANQQALTASVTTYWLNKIMSLISLPLAVLPFKDNAVQEAAIVQVLRYMANNDPPLFPNRDGYRAVIRVQLAQRKSSSERLWAELKSLSWPPWKVSRTGMDDAIGPEHGNSRARETLLQMQSAGYALLDWEKAVQAYAGWDTDGTPTIQTRALVPRSTPKFTHTSAKWVARIESTRTVQEAWACYLAWEDLGIASDESVSLAIMKRLHQEQQRQRRESGNSPAVHHSNSWPLLPGDSQEISPLPPSIHLYTYTRTTPPTVDELYDQLHQRGFLFKNHLLAFVVANASSIQTGIRRLENSMACYPSIQGLLLPEAIDFSAIPIEVFTATVKLLGRFANIPRRKALTQWKYCPTEKTQSTPLLDGQELSLEHLAVHALELLRMRQTNFRPAWNAVLEALTIEANLNGMRKALAEERNVQTRKILHTIGSDTNNHLDRCGGALLAYRLVRYTLTMLRNLHLDLDSAGFRSLCLATENLAIGAWTILQIEPSAFNAKSNAELTVLSRYTHEAKKMLRSNNHEERLKGEFRTLVGTEDSGGSDTGIKGLESETSSSTDESAALPVLLTVPNPALLHAYVRGLGWLADYEGLQWLVKWMNEHRDALAERMSRDRSGAVMMRRALVAIRVFLERSWLSDPQNRCSRGGNTADPLHSNASQSNSGRGEKILQRLRSAAPPCLIQSIKHDIGKLEAWGGWASDEEVEEYCQHARFSLIR